MWHGDCTTMLLWDDVGDDWGQYIYADENERPVDEKLCYDMLTQSKKTSMT